MNVQELRVKRDNVVKEWDKEMKLLLDGKSVSRKSVVETIGKSRLDHFVRVAKENPEQKSFFIGTGMLTVKGVIK